MLVSSRKKTVLLGISLLSAATLLQGCPLVLLGAAGGGTIMASQRRTIGTQTEDREIQIKAATKLANTLKEGAHVNVTVFNRRVLLTGEVPDEATQQKTLAAIRAVANIQGVVNELKIQKASDLMSRSNDAYLTAKVKTALIQAKNLSTNFFKVVTERGNVYLMGLVTPEEAAQAADITSRLPGVVQVVKVFEYITPKQKKDLAPPINTIGETTSTPATITTSATTNAHLAPSTSSTSTVSTHPISGASISATHLNNTSTATAK